MKTLIIYAHPEHESHSKYALNLIEEKLKSKNNEYELLDLYKMKFNPVLSHDELYTSKEKGVNSEIKELQEKITESQHLIFIYPIWWGTMPGIMKGFIDRVFTSGFAFQYVGHIPKGLLNGKKATVFVSMGSPKAIAWIRGNRFKKAIETDMLGFCGIKSKTYSVDSARQLNDLQKAKIQSNVNKALG